VKIKKKETHVANKKEGTVGSKTKRWRTRPTRTKKRARAAAAWREEEKKGMRRSGQSGEIERGRERKGRQHKRCAKRGKSKRGGRWARFKESPRQ